MHAPGIDPSYLEGMTPAESRFVRDRVQKELKAEMELRIAFAKAGLRL